MRKKKQQPINARGLDVGTAIIVDSFKEQEMVARVLRARGFALKYHTHPIDGVYKIVICGTPYPKETEDVTDNHEDEKK